MIKRLHVQNSRVAERVLQVQIPAYQVEAQWIGFEGIPYLKDTLETLAASEEVFYGIEYEGELAGVIGFEEKEELLDICRLVVHPRHFRKGIGRCLVEHVLENHGHGKKVVVRTGRQNLPAIRLYEKLGFAIAGEREIAPGVFLAIFERPPASD